MLGSIILDSVSRHKSIENFVQCSLPAFAIITGPNGSGKTQLLEAIAEGKITVHANGTHIIPEDRILFLQLGSVLPVNTNRQTASALRQDNWNKIEQLDREVIQGIRNEYINVALQVAGLEAKRADIEQLRSFEQYNFINDQLHDDHKIVLAKWIGNAQTRIKNHARGKWNDPRNTYLFNAAVDEFDARLFFSGTESMTNVLDRVAIASSSLFFDLASALAAYHYECERNKYDRYQFQTQGRSSVQWLTDDEFAAKYGPKPWDLINKLLEQMSLSIRIGVPDNGMNDPFSLTFLKHGRPVQMSPNDLSGGEKVILAMATAIYGSRSSAGAKVFPRLILLDELDAPLHPSLLKDFIDALKLMFERTDTFCILTTHSPSTAALSPAGSLFQLQPGPKHVLMPTNKESATQLLTNGLLTVTENTRLVFVEAKADAELYQSIFEFLRRTGRTKVTPNLIFLPTSDEKDEKGGGKDQVRQWVEKLSRSPAICVRGLIDRDLDNSTSSHVVVLDRYALENFLLDPIVVIGCILNDSGKPDFLDNSFERPEPAELRSMGHEQRQRIADQFCRFIESQRSDLRSQHPGNFVFKDMSGNEMSLPTWLRDHRGHELMTIYRAVFQTKYVRENIFKSKYTKLTNMLTEILPELIPQPLVHTILGLQLT